MDKLILWSVTAKAKFTHGVGMIMDNAANLQIYKKLFYKNKTLNNARFKFKSKTKFNLIKNLIL